MKKKLFIFSFISFVFLSSCINDKKQVENPFETPEECVKEYLNARDSCDIVRMLNCYSYDTKYERIIREGIQKELNGIAEKKELHPDYYYRIDTIKLKEMYPNSAVVTVYYTDGYSKDELSSWDYDVDLVKDSTNWKLEAKLSIGFDIR